MGYNDYMYDKYTSKRHSTACYNCKTELNIIESDQTPGFRETEYCRCPVCKTVLDESREVSFSVSIK